MQCQAPDCDAQIHPERLAAQPNTRTCGRPSCRRAYRLKVLARNQKNYRQRKKESDQ